MELSIAGHVKPCCKLTTPIKKNDSDAYSPNYDNGDVFINVHDVDLEYAFKSQGMGDLRYEFAAGKKPELCSNCWDEEAAGIKSLRQAGNDIFNLYHLHNPRELAQTETPKILDLKFGNVCNLKCRICDPFHSTTWNAEYQKDMSMPRDPRYREIDSFMNEKNWKVLKKWIPGLQRILFFGGEPLLQKDVYKTLDLIVEMNHAKDIEIGINTNSSIFDKKFVGHWDKFKHIDLMHSIDDIGPRFEYQRNPIKWDKAQDVMHKYNEAKRDNVRIIFYLTVSIFNVYYLPEILEWYKENYPEHFIVVNMVHYPSHFSIINLPDKMKSDVAHRLKFINEEDYNFEYSGQVRAVIDFLAPNRDENEFQKALVEIKRADAFRKENFAATFPEIKEHFPL